MYCSVRSSRGSAEPAAAQTRFAPVARVNGDVVTAYELDQRVRFLTLLNAPGEIRDDAARPADRGAAAAPGRARRRRHGERRRARRGHGGIRRPRQPRPRRVRGGDRARRRRRGDVPRLRRGRSRLAQCGARAVRPRRRRHRRRRGRPRSPRSAPAPASACSCPRSSFPPRRPPRSTRRAPRAAEIAPHRHPAAPSPTPRAPIRRRPRRRPAGGSTGPTVANLPPEVAQQVLDAAARPGDRAGAGAQRHRALPAARARGGARGAPAPPTRSIRAST